MDHFSKLLEAYNRQIAHVVQTRKDTSDLKGFKLSKESQALLRKAAAGGLAWIRIKGNQLIYTLPMTYPDYLNLRMENAASVRAEIEKKTASVKSIQKALLSLVSLYENDVRFSHENNAFVVKVGHPQSAYTTFYYWRGGTYKPNAVMYVAQHYKKTKTKRIAALIERLGHDDVEQRKTAMAGLRAEGAWARPQLEAALYHENPEIRARVRKVLRAAKMPDRTKSGRTVPPAEITRRMQAFLLTGRVPD